MSVSSWTFVVAMFERTTKYLNSSSQTLPAFSPRRSYLTCAWCKIVRSWKKKLTNYHTGAWSQFQWLPGSYQCCFMCACAISKHVCGCACVSACVSACMHARCACVRAWFTADFSKHIIISLKPFFRSLPSRSKNYRSSLRSILDSFRDWQCYACNGHQAVRSIWVHKFDKTCDPLYDLKEGVTFGSVVFTDAESAFVILGYKRGVERNAVEARSFRRLIK